MTLNEKAIEAMGWDKAGLMPAIALDANTGAALMLAYMNADSLRRTLELGQAVFWSRSRQTLWRKGETSGNTLQVVDMRIDCDADTLLLLVEPAGPVCHTGETTCFFRSLDEFAADPRRL